MRREELADVIGLVAREAESYLAGLDERPVSGAGAVEALPAQDTALPEEGAGAVAALGELLEAGLEGAAHSAGPRFFHFVTGGVTPAALGADWLASTFDQMAGLWISSPVAARLETIGLRWLRELFDLPAEWGGVLTTGATAANVVGLTAAREWWGAGHGVDVAEDGLAGLPPMPVFSSGYIHASALKALAMAGLGRGRVRIFAADETGRLDAAALERALAELEGAPAILVGNAGDVNTGAFDPLAELADLAEAHNAWLHVDGAFGLFARLVPETTDLAAGVERAHSVASDGHKWLNVPYDCGFVFVRDPRALAFAFTLEAAYLPAADDERPNFGFLGPESSRRARAFAVWATLRAYGRAGYRRMVERHLAPGAAGRRGGRARARPRAARARAAERRLLPLPPRRPGRARGGRAERQAGGGDPRRRAGLRGHDALHRQDGLPPDLRQLAHAAGGRRPPCRGRPRARRRASRPHKVASIPLGQADSRVTK